MNRLMVGDIVRVIIDFGSQEPAPTFGYGQIIGQEGKFWVVQLIGNFAGPLVCYADQLLSIYRPNCTQCMEHSNHHV